MFYPLPPSGSICRHIERRKGFEPFMHYIILCRSMTNAQRAARTLQAAKIFASVTQAPQRANPGGCVYGVKIGARNLEAAEEVLSHAGIETGGVFELAPNGGIREVER